MKPICPSCKGKVIYYRQKTGEYVCRTCGKVWREDD